MQIFTIVYIRYFCFSYEEGINRNATGNIVPVSHYIFFRSTHRECTALNEYKARHSFNILCFEHVKTTLVLIVIVPSCSTTLVMFVFIKQTTFTGSDTCKSSYK